MDKQENLESLREMISAVIYGLVIGDSLGVPVEFEERDNYILDDMIGYGTYHQPPGTWSDDTSLTLALMEHLGEKSNLSILMDKFVAYREGYLTPFGYCFDIGIATNEAIEIYLSGILFETKYQKKTKRYYLCYNVSENFFNCQRLSVSLLSQT